MSRHASDEALYRLALRGDRSGSDPAGRHVQGCARCRSLVSDFRRLRAELSVPLEEPPRDALERAYALVDPPPPRQEHLASFSVAQLLHDDHVSESELALRSPLSSQHQVWRVRSADVDLRFERGGLGAEAAVLGQILWRGADDPPEESGSVWLLQPRRRPAHAVIAPSGEFVLPAPEAKAWTVVLDWGPLRARLVSS